MSMMKPLFPLCLATLLIVGCQTSERGTLRPTPAQPESAIKVQVESVPESPTRQKPEVEGYLNLGVKYYSEGRYRDALEQFNRVLALDPKNEIAKRYARECTMYLTPGAVDEHVVEYPEAPN